MIYTIKMDTYGRQLNNNINYPFLVTDKSPGINHPPGFKLTLLPYQSRCVGVALAMENNPKYTSISGDSYTSNEGIFGMPFSAGKTIMFLALVATQKRPTSNVCNNITDSMFVYNDLCISIGHMPISTIEYKPKFNNVLDVSIILVSKTVFWQWIGEIEKFTSFKYLGIENVEDLNKLLAIHNNIELLNMYDIIIIKNGNTSSNVEFPMSMNTDDTNIANRVGKKFLDIISLFFRDYIIARVGYDDADQLKNINHAYPIKTLYTWYLSASPGYMNFGESRFDTWNSSSYFGNYADRPKVNRHKVSKCTFLANSGDYKAHIIGVKFPFKFPMLRYGLTRRYFTINVESSYLQKYINIGRPNHYIYEIENEACGEMMLEGIKILISKDTDNIIEAVNAGAISDAADMGGIKADSIAEMLGILFKKEIESVKHYKKVLAFMEYLLTTVKETIPNVVGYFDIEVQNPLWNPKLKKKNHCDKMIPYTYTVRDIRKGIIPLHWRQTLDSKDGTIPTEFLRCTKLLAECSTKIEVVKGMFNDICQICNLPLKGSMSTDIDIDLDNLNMLDFDDDMFSDDEDTPLLTDSSGFEDLCILPCCSQTIHAQCALMTCNFRKMFYNVTDSSGKDIEQYVIEGKCPYDRNHKVNFQKMIFLSKNTAFEDLENKGIEEMADEIKDTKEPEVHTVNIEDEYIPKDKIDAAIAIIRNRRIKGRKQVDIYVPNLMEGAKSLPNSTGKPKVLIFTNFDSGIEQLRERFKLEEDIKWAVLEGQATQTQRTVADFDNGKIDILLINSTERCAGLNLQNATDVIFMHKINDINILTQSLGRIQRIGRLCNANIHYLLFRNECKNMKKMFRFTAVSKQIKKEKEAAANNENEDSDPESESESESDNYVIPLVESE
jgi:hypothetical protein